MGVDFSLEAVDRMAENPLVGVWRLVSCDAIRPKGRRVPIYGKRPVGRLFYDAAGHMSVHIMKSSRRDPEGEVKAGDRDNVEKTARTGYQAYFSTYTVDTVRHMIFHKVLGSLLPNWTGTTQTRYYAFDEQKRLVLSTAPPGSVPTGKPIVQLVWERLA